MLYQIYNVGSQVCSVVSIYALVVVVNFIRRDITEDKRTLPTRIYYMYVHVQQYVVHVGAT